MKLTFWQKFDALPLENKPYRQKVNYYITSMGIGNNEAVNLTWKHFLDLPSNYPEIMLETAIKQYAEKNNIKIY